jgi:hypothetical protein
MKFKTLTMFCIAPLALAAPNPEVHDAGNSSIITPQTFGAIGDGTRHPISKTDLEAHAGKWIGNYQVGDEWDYVALQEAINACFQNGPGPCALCPAAALGTGMDSEACLPKARCRRYNLAGIEQAGNQLPEPWTVDALVCGTQHLGKPSYSMSAPKNCHPSCTYRVQLPTRCVGWLLSPIHPFLACSSP